jgi:hypothetical protein
MGIGVIVRTQVITLIIIITIVGWIVIIVINKVESIIQIIIK